MLRIPLFLLLLLYCGAAQARPFSLRSDTFAFSNDTVLSYGVDELGNLEIKLRDKPVEYGHRCFVLTRAVLQFNQFARFAPEQPRLSRQEYRKIILRLGRIPVWSRGPAQPIVIPGYRDLRHFSIAYEGLLKENLGGWLATYLRVGNWRLISPHPRAGQAATARWLLKSMDEHRLRALYLSDFPFMNHMVVVYAVEQRAAGNLRFLVYDPNYPGEPTYLDYLAAQRSFEFAKRWYFPGGRVNVMRVYISPFH